MEKLAQILIPAIALFLLFHLSDSLTTSDLNDRDVLLLPSDNPRAVHNTDSPDAVADPNSDIAEPEHEHEGFVSVPLTKLDFHEGSIPLSLRFPHRRRFGRDCRHGFMRRHGMRPREIPYGNDMILSDKKDGADEFVGRSRFHLVNRRPRLEVSAPWKGEEDVFLKPKEFEGGFDEDHMFEMPRKFMRHDEDDDDDWHKEKHHRRHHHKHHHEDDEEDGPHEHGEHRHRDDDEDDKSGILSKTRKFFDDLF